MKIKTTKKTSNKSLSGRGKRFCILVSRFNEEITGGLLKSCVKVLAEHGVSPQNISIHHVPGSFELPLAARWAADRKKFQGIIALGCIIRGETPHDRYIAQEVTRGLGQVSLDTGTPVILGVLTTLNERQARARSQPGGRDKGREAALTALEMADLRRQMTR